MIREEEWRLWVAGEADEREVRERIYLNPKILPIPHPSESCRSISILLRQRIKSFSLSTRSSAPRSVEILGLNWWETHIQVHI